MSADRDGGGVLFIMSAFLAFLALVWLLVALIAAIWLNAFQAYMAGGIGAHVALFIAIAYGIRTRRAGGGEP